MVREVRACLTLSVITALSGISRERRSPAPRRDAGAARQFFERAIRTTTRPVEVVTDRAPTYPVVLEELLPAAWHRTDRCMPTTGLRPIMAG